jgi:hypothetical protein
MGGCPRALQQARALGRPGQGRTGRAASARPPRLLAIPTIRPWARTACDDSRPLNSS